MPVNPIRRRALFAAAACPWVSLLPGCATPLPLGAPAWADAPAATALLRESAQAHGLGAYRQLSDINVAYTGEWRPFINGVQPEVVDAGFRGRSQERLMPALGVNAQAYEGASGSKFVFWQRGSAEQPGDLSLWFNGQRSRDAALQRAAAVVAESYGLFLLGPLWLTDRTVALQLAGTERVDGRLCDVLDAWVRPGLGLSLLDRVTLCIDRDNRITRRARFTLEGFERTRGAVAEVDTYDHEQRFGVLWPMRSYERVVHPIALPAHDWRIDGLDVNRGYGREALAGPVFTGLAAAPARPV
jgi:hypothetical protein